ncbi:MAG: cytochrome c-type biogenesis CcmF C-terminal domain-containing protein [Actinomycetota bacterium]
MGSLALDLALLGAVLWGVGASVPRLRRLVPVASGIVAALAVASVLSLTAALVRGDPALAYVERHSSEATPPAYRIAGTWGGMEGSLLTWSAIVAVVVAVAMTRRRPPATELAVLGAITTASFLAITRFTASPFERLEAPTGSGQGLLGVLQHPAMLYHPPILYAGLALVAVPFAITIGALWRRRLDDAWLDRTIGWLRVSWLVLGLGILTGSHWAYAELGWGGFWAWDPVENAALLPWLAVTVALHGASAVRSTRRLAVTTAAAICGAFCLMVSGVYVTRSGSTGSIHAFAESPAVGRPLLVLAAGFAVLSIVALARQPVADGPRFAWRRDVGLGFQAALGGVAVLAIALGTFWPVVEGLWRSGGGPRELVRPGYYEAALAPVVVTSLVAMAVVPELRWRSGRRPGYGAVVGGFGGGLAAVALLVGLGFPGVPGGLVALAAGVAAGAAIGSVVGGTPARRSDRHVGVAVAHAGFALLLLAATVAASGGDERISLDVGETREVGSWTITLESIVTGETDRYELVRARVTVLADGRTTEHEPELRAYDGQLVPTAESSIVGAAAGDTIVVVESVRPDASGVVVTVRTRPLMPWVWIGAMTMLVGGAIAMSARRRSVSADGPGAGSRPPATTAQR